jgi:hypothetical protein
MGAPNACSGRRYCSVCGRRIKANKSVSNGIGPKCLKKRLENERRQRLLFDEWEGNAQK